MADRYFTPEEVEALIPTLTDLVERLQSAHAEAESRRARMKAEEDRVAFSGGGIFDQAGWRKDRDGGVERAHKAIEGIHDVGGTPKDAKLGLVDFPTVRNGRVVNLCWKHGETRVTWWHGMDEGWAARKAL